MTAKISTATELDALPVGTVLADDGMHPFWRDRVLGWCAANGTRGVDADTAIRDGGPFTVLYLPTDPLGTEASRDLSRPPTAPHGEAHSMTQPPAPRWCQCRGLGSIVTNDPRPGDRDDCPQCQARDEDEARRAGRDGYPPTTKADPTERSATA